MLLRARTLAVGQALTGQRKDHRAKERAASALTPTALGTRPPIVFNLPDFAPRLE